MYRAIAIELNKLQEFLALGEASFIVSKHHIRYDTKCLRKEIAMRVCGLWLTLKLDMGNGRLFTLSPGLGLYILPMIPTLATVSRILTWKKKKNMDWENKGLLRPSGWISDWTQWGPLYKLLRFWPRGAEICLSCSCPMQTSSINSCL